ncbi:MAG: hypothetical protein V4692_02055, partial [Bdellovibrionota bacterium]
MTKLNQPRRDEGQILKLKQTLLSVSTICLLAACSPMQFASINKDIGPQKTDNCGNPIPPPG